MDFFHDGLSLWHTSNIHPSDLFTNRAGYLTVSMSLAAA